MTWYYRAETKGIQSWILQTSRLREICGGSWVIETLAERASELRGDARVLQEAAGAVSYAFSSREDLERFASRWPRCVEETAPGLQTVQAWVAEDGAGDWRVRLGEKLRERRNLACADLPEAGPWLSRTGRSGLPAVVLPSSAPRGPDRLSVDAATAAKERAYRDQKSRWRVVADTTLALKESGEGLLAVVHADGTGVGREVMKVTSEDLPAFSKALASCVEDALARAIAHVAGDKATELDLQVIVVGGDDVTLVCAASMALDLTRVWLREFEALTAERLAPFGAAGLRAGAGIAVTSRRYPFRRAYALAEELCKAAKAAVKNGRDAQDSALAFRRVTTSIGDHVLGQGVWSIGGQGAVPPLEALVALRDATGKIARGPLRTWLTAFEDAALRFAVSDDDAFTPGPIAAKLWTRMHDTRPDEFSAIDAALHAVCQDARDGRGPQLQVTSRRSGGKVFERARIWTPIRDALVLRTIASRGRKQETEGEEVGR